MTGGTGRVLRNVSELCRTLSIHIEVTVAWQRTSAGDGMTHAG